LGSHFFSPALERSELPEIVTEPQLLGIIGLRDPEVVFVVVELVEVLLLLLMLMGKFRCVRNKKPNERIATMRFVYARMRNLFCRCSGVADTFARARIMNH
jgi:hypothetical protein